MSGPLTNEDDTGIENGRQISLEGQFSAKRVSEILEKQSNISEDTESLAGEFPDCILKCKSVFKCRICPRIVCLNEESMRTHLQSKVKHVTYFRLIGNKLSSTIPYSSFLS